MCKEEKTKEKAKKKLKIIKILPRKKKQEIKNFVKCN